MGYWLRVKDASHDNGLLRFVEGGSLVEDKPEQMTCEPLCL